MWKIIVSTSNSDSHSLGLTKSWKWVIAKIPNSQIPCLATPPIFFVPFLFLKPHVEKEKRVPILSPLALPCIQPSVMWLSFSSYHVYFMKFIFPESGWVGCDCPWPVGCGGRTVPVPNLVLRKPAALVCSPGMLPSPWNKPWLVRWVRDHTEQTLVSLVVPNS